MLGAALPVWTPTPMIMGTSRRKLVVRADADAEDYFTRIGAAGGTITDAAKIAVNRLVYDLKAGDVWNRLFDVGVFAGASLTAALVKLKYPAGVASTLTNVNFISGDYAQATGLKGNGSTKYLRTGVAPSAIEFNTPHYHGSLAAYVRSASANGESNPVLLGMASGSGGSDSASNYLMMDDVNAANFTFGGEGLGTNVLAVTDPPGMLIGVATSLSARRLFWNGSPQVGSRDTGLATGDGSDREFYVMAQNQGGTAARHHDAHLAFYAIGGELTESHGAALHLAVQLFQTSLGRQV